jgi:hypothetical protein
MDYAIVGRQDFYQDSRIRRMKDITVVTTSMRHVCGCVAHLSLWMTHVRYLDYIVVVCMDRIVCGGKYNLTSAIE